MEEKIGAYLDNSLSAPEMQELDNWKNESKENAEVFFESKEAWLRSQKPQKTNISNEALRQILARENTSKMKFMKKKISYLYAVAAGVALLIVSIFLLTGTTESGNYKELRLVDGTDVFLQGNAALSFEKFTENNRKVELNGKAFFDVERSESSPFSIQTKNALIEVLGTSFMVKTQEGYTEVAVTDGEIELVRNASNPRKMVSMKLKAGETAFVTEANSGIIKRNTRDENIFAWKTKVMTFKRAKMSEVAVLLNEVYGVEITFESPRFENCQLTAKIHKKKLKDALEIISRTFGVEYDLQDNKATFGGAGC